MTKEQHDALMFCIGYTSIKNVQFHNALIDLLCDLEDNSKFSNEPIGYLSDIALEELKRGTAAKIDSAACFKGKPVYFKYSK